MKRILTLVLLLSGIFTTTRTHAQLNDSFPYNWEVELIKQGFPGERPFFNIPGITPQMMDFTGDLKPDLTYFKYPSEEDYSGASLIIYDGANQEAVKELFIEEIGTIEGAMIEKNEVRVAGFLYTGEGNPKLIALRVGEGLILYNPKLIGVRPPQVFSPNDYRLIGIADVIESEADDVILLNKEGRYYEVYALREMP